MGIAVDVGPNGFDQLEQNHFYVFPQIYFENFMIKVGVLMSKYKSLYEWYPFA